MLTRNFRDTRNGLELSFWAATQDVPLWLRFSAQEAVCFAERGRSLSLPDGIRSRPVDLVSMDGSPVDAIYAQRWRQLQDWALREPQLLETDVKPHERYLMERFVRAGFQATGDVIEHAGFREMHNPKLSPLDYTPPLKRLALDIETRGNSQDLYSIAGAVPDGDARVFMLGNAPDEFRDGYLLHYQHDERSLLEAFFAWVSDIDPDVLTGWSVVGFDLAFLDAKCKKLGMRLDLGRGPEPASVFDAGTGSARGPRVARIPGRAVLDGIDMLKAAFYSFESFSLENVAQEFLGTGKLISSEHDKVAEINRLFRDNKPQLADYNLRDCTLVNDIIDKADLVSFAAARARLTGLSLDRLAGATAAFDNLYLPLLHRAGRVANNVDTGSAGEHSPGGYVMDSVPGLYSNVLVLDFKSLYPSIIRSFFVDPLALVSAGEEADPVPGFSGAEFHRSKHILPGLIESLWQARDAAKSNGDQALSMAIKIIMNSFYGVLGTTACRFYDPKLASSITRRGHEIITGSREVVQEAGYAVIYGDTDSVFVHVGDRCTSDEADDIGHQLAERIDRHWQDELANRYRLQSHLEVEFETRYARFFMPTVRGMSTGSKKRYAGLVERPGTEPDVVIKGLEAARTDWTPLARRFQRELFTRVFTDQPVDDYVRTVCTDMRRGVCDAELVYRKRLRRDVADYHRNVPPHVQAARMLANPGNSIRYVVTTQGPQPVEQQTAALDYDHYQQRQLAPAADGILRCLGRSFAELTDAQLGLF